MYICEICYRTYTDPTVVKCSGCGASGYIFSEEDLRSQIQNRQMLLTIIDRTKESSDGR
jgi:hypothetical protein